MKKNLLSVNLAEILGRILHFLERQSKQVKAGGFSVLVRKICKLLLKMTLFLPAIISIVIIRILRPFIMIRLGRLDISRIGGAYSADFYLSERSLGMQHKRNFDIFYFTTVNKTICNKQWLKMWKRVLRIFPIWNLAKMIYVIQKEFFHNHHTVPLTTITELHNESLDKNSSKLKPILTYKKPHLFFTRQEEEFGRQALIDMGIRGGKPFVCFHARDPAYLNTVYPVMDWSYHNYRDSNIHNYMMSVDELTRKGYYAIRMGAVVKEKIITNNPAIIDYATNGRRSDFLDIYLGAKCSFFICSDTGIAIIPEVFRRPAVYTNWTPIKRISPWCLNGLFILKKFYLSRERRFLKFRELIDLQFGEIQTDNFFKQNGIELIENTPEEIMAVVIEMEQRLKGAWRTTEEDEQLQQRFWALFGPYKLKSPSVRIGADFLRQNQHLLEEPKELRFLIS